MEGLRTNEGTSSMSAAIASSRDTGRGSASATPRGHREAHDEQRKDHVVVHRAALCSESAADRRVEAAAIVSCSLGVELLCTSDRILLTSPSCCALLSAVRWRGAAASVASAPMLLDGGAQGVGGSAARQLAGAAPAIDALLHSGRWRGRRRSSGSAGMEQRRGWRARRRDEQRGQRGARRCTTATRHSDDAARCRPKLGHLTIRRG